MRSQDIVIGESYRFKARPKYGWAKAIEISKPKTGVNTQDYQVVKCEHTVNKNENFGFIRYFRPCDLIKEKN